jgi:hypothetical protein
MAKAAADSRDPGAAPAEGVAIAAAGPEPAKSESGSLFSRLWHATPAKGEEGTPKEPAASASAAAAPEPASAPAPSPPKRKDRSATSAKPADSKTRPQKSVTAPAEGAPHAALSPSERASKAVAMLHPSPATQDKQ